MTKKDNDALRKALKDLARDWERDRKKCLSQEKINRQQAARLSTSNVWAVAAIDTILHAEHIAGVEEGYKSAIARLRFTLKKH